MGHLNSTKAVTKIDGSLECLYEYRAFGEELKKLGTGDAKYTYGGKELDNETNLYYFNARYYDATIGRFINVDPIQDGYNWYVYCENNPLSFVDPTGLLIGVQVHRVILFGLIKTIKYHSSIRITLDTLELKRAFANNKDIITPKNGDPYFTLGGGPSFFGSLKGGINRKYDKDMNIKKAEYELVDLKGKDEITVIKSMMQSLKNYNKNKVDYDALVADNIKDKKWWIPDDSFNSNSLISGLIKNEGLEVPELKSDVPGYNKPLPKEKFQIKTKIK